MVSNQGLAQFSISKVPSEADTRLKKDSRNPSPPSVTSFSARPGSAPRKDGCARSAIRYLHGGTEPEPD